MGKWLRWYEGTCEDAKFRVVATCANVTARVTLCDVIAVWALLLEDAASLRNRGVATKGKDFFIIVLGISEEAFDAIIENMISLDMVSVEDDGIHIQNWSKRQFEVDKKDPTNAERQKRWRNKNKTASKRNSNGSVTVETRPDTDTDTDTERKKEEQPAAVLPPVYVFERGRVKLTRKNFDEWEKAFSDLTLRAELEAMAEWASEQKNWFPALSAALAKRNREVSLQKTAVAAGVAAGTRKRQTGGGWA